MKFRITLRVAMIAPIMLWAAMLGWMFFLPPRSPWLGLVAVVLVVSGVTALAAIVDGAVALIRSPQTRIPLNVVCVILAAIPSTLFTAWCAHVFLG